MAGPRRVSKRGHTHDTRALVVAAHAQGVSTPTARTGMPPTALVVQVGEHPALRSDSSRHPTGAPLSGWLDQREAGLDQPLARSDALASTVVAEASRLRRCRCRAHDRRQLSDLEAVLPPHPSLRAGATPLTSLPGAAPTA
jgi:hypothetical protein